MTACHDCPDLDASAMPPGWTPRARCCRDEHIDRRLAGSYDAWTGIEDARKASDGAEASKSRQQRRWEARKGQG